MDFTWFIPDHVKLRFFDRVVESLAQAAQSVDDDAARFFRGFHSDVEFHEALDRALERAVRCFVNEYDDQEIVAAVTQNTRFWDIPSVQAAIREIILYPSSFLEAEKKVLYKNFADVMPGVEEQRTNQAILFFLRCLAREVICIPKLQPLYMVQYQKASLEHAQLMVSTLLELKSDQQTMIHILDGVARQKLLAIPETNRTHRNLLMLVSDTDSHFIDILNRDLENARTEKQEIRKSLSDLNNQPNDLGDLQEKFQKKTKKIRRIKCQLRDLGQNVEENSIDEDSFSSYPIEITSPQLTTTPSHEVVNLKELKGMLISYLRRVDTTLANLNIEALNWNPFSGGGNSVCVLASHIAGAAEEWVCRYAGGLSINRDRNAEFVAVVSSVDELRERVQDVERNTAKVIDGLNENDLRRIVFPIGRAKAECTVLWCIVHAIEHTAYHLGELDALIRLYDLYKSEDLPLVSKIKISETRQGIQ